MTTTTARRRSSARRCSRATSLRARSASASACPACRCPRSVRQATTSRACLSSAAWRRSSNGWPRLCARLCVSVSVSADGRAQKKSCVFLPMLHCCCCCRITARRHCASGGGRVGCGPGDGVRASTFIEPFSLTADRVPSQLLWSSARAPVRIDKEVDDLAKKVHVVLQVVDDVDLVEDNARVEHVGR